MVDWRAVRITWSVLLTLGCVGFLYAAQRTILVFLLAIFFAYLLSPVVRLVDRFTPRRISRTLSLAFVYVLLITVLVSVVSGVAMRASAEAGNLISRLPELTQRAHQLPTMALPPLLESLRGPVLQLVQEQIEGGLDKALPMLRAAMGQVLVTIGNLGFAVMVPILSFFFLKDGMELREAMVGFVEHGERREFLEGLLDDVHAMLADYIRALFLLSVAVFIAFELFFQTMRVPYASLLATIAALLEFIPVIGPLTTALVACIVALASGYVGVGWLVLFFVVYRIFQDYVLQPFLLGSGVELHPLLIVFGALAGEQVAGIAGMIFSVPVIATIRLIYVRSTRRLQE